MLNLIPNTCHKKGERKMYKTNDIKIIPYKEFKST